VPGVGKLARAAEQPGRCPDAVLALQRTAGNRALGQLVAGTVQRASDPAVETVGEPVYKDGGGHLWQVNFTVPGNHSEGWVVQEINADLTPVGGGPAVPHHFWEAWYVKKTPATPETPTPNDSYQAPVSKEKAGRNRIKGTARFFERSETGAKWKPWEPTLPGFSTESGTWANDLLATTKQPPFWKGGGTDHDLNILWDAEGTRAPQTDPKTPFKKIDSFEW
jgi:hypothetical protein